MTPRSATNKKLQMQLKNDNFSTKNYWILICESHVTIAKQKSGESATQEIQITKRDLDAIVDWYNRDQKP